MSEFFNNAAQAISGFFSEPPIPLPLLILLIIGIVFLILGLFTPVRYTVDAAKHHDKIKADANVSIMLGLVHVLAMLRKNGGFLIRFQIKFIGITLFQRTMPVAKLLEPSPEPKLESETIRPNVRRIKLSELPEDGAKKAEEEKKKAKPEKEGEEKIGLSYFLKMPDKKEFFDAIMTLIKGIMNEVAPKSIMLHARLGTGDPCSTAQISGLGYAAGGIFRQDIVIRPDFEQKIFEGKLRMQGSLLPAKLIFMVIKCIKTKPVWRTIKLFMKGRRK
ncbi:MAG: DUF2953 domain-containing protein [Firmicutes bacterium]|nr:DUF2953 domain-containing protein [Bacillota bacterium]